MYKAYFAPALVYIKSCLKSVVIKPYNRRWNQNRKPLFQYKNILFLEHPVKKWDINVCIGFNPGFMVAIKLYCLVKKFLDHSQEI